MQDFIQACEAGDFYRTVSMLRDERYGVPINAPVVGAYAAI